MTDEEKTETRRLARAIRSSRYSLKVDVTERVSLRHGEIAATLVVSPDGTIAFDMQRGRPSGRKIPGGGLLRFAEWGDDGPVLWDVTGLAGGYELDRDFARLLPFLRRCLEQHGAAIVADSP